MVKSLDFLAETVRASKNPFPQVDARPEKPQKHRYERRKIKAILRQSDWQEDAQLGVTDYNPSPQ
jgi:hypothetical protein